MIFAAIFTVSLLAIGLISVLWIKLVSAPFGFMLFCGTFFPGIFILISLLADADQGSIRSISDFKRAIFDGGAWFLRWALAMLSVVVIAGIVFIFSEHAPYL